MAGIHRDKKRRACCSVECRVQSLLDRLLQTGPGKIGNENFQGKYLVKKITLIFRLLFPGEGRGPGFFDPEASWGHRTGYFHR
jgi:hypothetical protein